MVKPNNRTRYQPQAKILNIPSGSGTRFCINDDDIKVKKQNTTIDLNEVEREKINKLRKKIYPDKKQ